MRDPKIPPLEPWLASLVRRERALGRTAAPAKEAAYSQVQAKLALASAASANAAAAAKIGAASAAKVSTAARTVLLLAKLAAVASLGGALAVVVVAPPGAAPSVNRPALSAPAPAVSHVAGPALATAQATTVSHSPDPPTDPPTAVTSPPIMAAPHRPIPAPSTPRRAALAAVESATAHDGPAPGRDDGTLAEERRLLDHAQRALAQRDATGALDDVGLHARRFPNGQLQAEREAIAIRALVVAGRVGDAEARARRFRAAFPNNLFGPAVELAVGKEK